MNINGLKLSFYYHDEDGKHATCCVLVDDNGIKIGFGLAICSKKDNFNKAVGRKIALTRAISHLPKSVRTEIWEEYKKHSKIK